MLQPASHASFVRLSLICWRGGATAAVLTLEPDVDESSKKMADRVAWSPARLGSNRDGERCYDRRPKYDLFDILL